jgi:fumarate hydratase class II
MRAASARLSSADWPNAAGGATTGISRAIPTRTPSPPRRLGSFAIGALRRGGQPATHQLLCITTELPTGRLAAQGGFRPQPPGAVGSSGNLTASRVGSAQTVTLDKSPCKLSANFRPMTGPRMERDSLGEIAVPADAAWGAQTQRAVENFAISGERMPAEVVRALARIKGAAAAENARLGVLEEDVAAAIAGAAAEVAAGERADQFPIDVFQTGSGTSTHMNVNEVLAHLAAERLGRPVHPNDHVNASQSSNDVFPSAVHLAALVGLTGDLVPALAELASALRDKSDELSGVVKAGRTHLMDATPVTLGQEFGGYAAAVEHGIERVEGCLGRVGELPLGGTAVGTGINAHPEFAGKAIAALSEMTGLEFREAENHFEAQAAKDAVVQASGSLKALAVSLTKLANDFRWLASGPRCGIGEIVLPETQPGSSIMPGKVNPVLCESVLQVAAHVIGCDATITICGQAGNFELNTMMPIMSLRFLEAIELSANVVNAFSAKCVAGTIADRARCEEMVERSLAMATALAPVIGYGSAAKIAQEALATGQSIRTLAQQKSLMAKEQLEKVLDPWSMTEPGIAGRGE